MIKKVLLLILVMTMSLTLFAESSDKSELVDVNKDSSLSSYFAKINKRVLADAEQPVAEKEEKTQAVTEADIPLVEKAAARPDAQVSSSMNRAVMSVIGLVLIALAFFAAIQKWGRRVGHKTIANHIKVLTQKSIGPKKQLMLIRVAGETILIGVTDQAINHLKTLSLMEDELPDFTEPKFSGQLRQKIEQTKISEDPEPVDGFAVSRLDEVKSEVAKRYLS